VDDALAVLDESFGSLSPFSLGMRMNYQVLLLLYSRFETLAKVGLLLA
jgi:hypothetical protein